MRYRNRTSLKATDMRAALSGSEGAPVDSGAKSNRLASQHKIGFVLVRPEGARQQWGRGSLNIVKSGASAGVGQVVVLLRSGNGGGGKGPDFWRGFGVGKRPTESSNWASMGASSACDFVRRRRADDRLRNEPKFLPVHSRSGAAMLERSRGTRQEAVASSQTMGSGAGRSAAR
jgi:hypothetical protein